MPVLSLLPLPPPPPPPPSPPGCLVAAQAALMTDHPSPGETKTDTNLLQADDYCTIHLHILFIRIYYTTESGTVKVMLDS